MGAPVTSMAPLDGDEHGHVGTAREAESPLKLSKQPL